MTGENDFEVLQRFVADWHEMICSEYHLDAWPECDDHQHRDGYAAKQALDRLRTSLDEATDRAANLEFALEGEKHNHKVDNEYLVAEKERLTASLDEARAALERIDQEADRFYTSSAAYDLHGAIKRIVRGTDG